MSSSQGLKKIDLLLIEETLSVQGILLKAECPSQLTFDFLLENADLPILEQNLNSQNLLALLYEYPDKLNSFSKLGDLFERVNNDTIAVFSEPEKAFSDIYLIVSCENKTSLGKYITSAKYGLFLYNYREILGESPSNYIMLIEGMKRNKLRFIEKNQKNTEKLEEKKAEAQSTKDLLAFFQSRSLRLEEELECANLALSQMQFQLEKKQRQLTEAQNIGLNCVVCRVNAKNVLLIPCGHVIYCTECAEQVRQADIDNTSPLQSILTCPNCGILVEEFHTINNSF